MAYATVEELAGKLNLNPVTHAVALQRVLDTGALEIDNWIGGGLDASASPEELALAATVNLAVAQDLWLVETLPAGIVGLDTGTPLFTPRNSFERHKYTLAPLKEEWGIA